MNQDFITIKKADCVNVSKQVFAKANTNLTNAQLLADGGSYDTATALLIISLEEYVKGLILYLDGHGFELRKIKGMKSIFQNHKLRYLLAFVLSVMWIVINDLTRLIGNILRDHELVKKYKFGAPGFEIILERYMKKMTILIKREIDFFSRMDRTRQVGLYADYQGNTIIRISKNEYQSFYAKVEKLKYMIKIIANPDHMDDDFSLNRVAKDVKKNGLYKSIENLISNINKPSVNSFADLRLAIDNFQSEMSNSTNIALFSTIVNKSVINNSTQPKQNRSLKN